MRFFGDSNTALLTIALSVFTLAGCQTTTHNTFSSWKHTSLEHTRFNVSSILDVPISEVQQRSRNNGQVLDEDWWLECGDGQIHIEHVPVGWFNTGTVSALRNKNAFTKSVLKSARQGSRLSDITALETATSNRLGHYADLVEPDGQTCQIAKFGIRAKQMRTYDNDMGAVDTYVELNYCGETRLDVAAVAENLGLLNDEANRDSPLQNKPLDQCPSVFRESSTPGQHTKSRPAEVTIIWPGTYDGIQKLNIRYNTTSGSFSIVLSEKNRCEGHYEADSPNTPLKARWWLQCTDGRSAKGYFYPESSTSLFGKGRDEKGVKILLGAELTSTS